MIIESTITAPAISTLCHRPSVWPSGMTPLIASMESGSDAGDECPESLAAYLELGGSGDVPDDPERRRRATSREARAILVQDDVEPRRHVEREPTRDPMHVSNEGVLAHRVLELRSFSTLDTLLGVRGRDFTHDGEHLRGR